MSPVVHGLLALHGMPVSGMFTHPVAGSQLSAVHGLLSSHEMLALEQTPPAQMPSDTWHLSVAVQASPSAFLQVPVALQALHGPHALLVQQKPSVQKRPAAHWSVEAHVAPMGFLPHMLPTQVLGDTQSALTEHVPLHAELPLHM
jgi:hypothetical protein